jgi:hypothetical protein
VPEHDRLSEVTGGSLAPGNNGRLSARGAGGGRPKMMDDDGVQVGEGRGPHSHVAVTSFVGGGGGSQASMPAAPRHSRPTSPRHERARGQWRG